MSIRVFVVIASFLIAFIFNGVLIGFERVPEPIKKAEEMKVEDLHKDMRWTAGTRRANLQAFGLPNEIVDQTLDRIKEIQVTDRDQELIEAMKAAPDVAGTLCSNESSLPSRYQALGMIIAGDRGSRRQVAPFEQLQAKIRFQPGFRATNIQSLYKATELIPNNKPDAFALNVAALLRGQETERVLKEDDWAEPTFGSLSIVSYLSGNAEVELDMVETFAQMHYLHEVARNPKNEFCGLRAAVPTGN